MSVARDPPPGRYEIRSKLGEGEMGKVYRAQDTKLDRPVVERILL
jgi:serine/threonine protein kinase